MQVLINHWVLSSKAFLARTHLNGFLCELQDANMFSYLVLRRLLHRIAFNLLVHLMHLQKLINFVLNIDHMKKGA